MLILHVIASLDPAAGGPPQVVYRLACAQADLGHEVHLVAYRGDSAARLRVQAEIAGGSSTVTIHELQRPSRIELLLGQAAKEFFRGLLPKVNVLHLHGIWESIIKIGAAIAREHGKPYVVAPHGMLDPWSLAQKKMNKKIAMALGQRSMLN